MSKMFISPGLRRAITVQSRIDDIIGQYTEDGGDETVMVSCFHSLTVTGYHYECLLADRGANVTEERVGSGIAITYGPGCCYDRDTNQSMPGCTRVTYSAKEIDAVARDLLEWLYHGKEPKIREVNPSEFHAEFIAGEDPSP